jgi:ADP-heptose:LPS heptosyltransferase
MSLRAALPGAHISYLVAESVAPIPRHCPTVDRTLTVPFPPLSTWPDTPGWADVVADRAPILRGHFDVAKLPRSDDPVSGALIAAAGVPVRFGYDSPATRPILTRALPPPTRCHVVEHAIELALAVVDLLGMVMPAEATGSPCFVPTVADEAELSVALGTAPGDAQNGPIVLHPGSGWPIKNWLPPGGAR